MTTSFADLPLFNHPAPAHNGSITSREAADSIKPHVNEIGGRVLRAIQQMPGGLTCQQVEDILNLSSGTVTARINELANCEPALITKGSDEHGLLIRRKNRSGRSAAVWFPNH